ncbi:MAG: GGDEF domain-containing protein [Cetobacterium sp.]
MRIKKYNILLLITTFFLALCLLFLIFGKANKIKKRNIDFFEAINISSETLNPLNLSVLEKKILADFEAIPENEYFYRYKEIAENNRLLLTSNSENNIGAYILRALLNSDKLSPEKQLYILNKLRVIDSLSGNVVNNIKITIEYFNLAEELNSEYDIATAKIGLSSIISSLGSHRTAISILKSIDFKNDKIPLINRLKILQHFHLAENEFFLKKYDESIGDLEKMIELSKNEPEDYSNNIFLLKNIIETQIYVKTNKKESALKTLNLSKEFFKNNQNNYFLNLDIFYLLTLEIYNLKYDFENFNISNVKKIIDVSEKVGDIIVLKTAFEILLEYYVETNDFSEYRNTIKLYDSYLYKINDANNKFFTLFVVEKSQFERFTAENRKLHTHIIILLVGVVFVLMISYKKIGSLDKKAKIDTLTNIGNRLAFNIKIKELKNKDYTMLLFDIDNFKKINDNFGHDFGDDVLSGIGKILKNLESKEVSFYRVGGEEFAVIFTNLKNSVSENKCEDIRQNIENLQWKHPLVVTISGGYCKKCKNTYVQCDLKLYEAKKSGKNKIIY